MNASVNQVFLVSLLVIALGYWLKRAVLPANAGGVLSKLLMHTTFPALLFDVFTKIQLDLSLIWLPLIAIGFGIVCQLIAMRLFRDLPNDPKGVLLMGSVGYNLGLFAYPLIEGIWGREGLRYAAMFDLGNSFLVFFVSYSAGIHYSPKGTGELRWGQVFRKIFSSIPLIFLLIALAINLLKIPVPSFLSDITSTLARANKAFVLLLLGIYLHFDFDKSSLRSLRNVVLLRYIMGLLVGSLLFMFLPFEPLYRTIILVCLVLPVGMVMLAFTEELGYDTKLAGAMANITIVISFILLWGLILGLGLA